MFGAYAIKRTAPRILIAIILVNLSIYMVSAVSEATRIVGNGLGDLITSPINSTSDYNFSVGDSNNLNGEALVLGAGILAGYKIYKNNSTGRASSTTEPEQQQLFDPDGLGGQTAPASGAGRLSRTKNYFFGTKSADSSTNTPGVFGRNKEIFLWILLFILLPVALVMLSIFVTLIFRQGLLILLAMTAPIACALYVLPGTEKYFKKWWDLFIKTLLVYPIIVAIFAISDVLASVIFNAFGGAAFGIGIIAGLIAMFAPLAMIPFAFKFAGGAVSTIYGTLTGGGKRFSEALKGNVNDQNSLRNRTKYGAANRTTQLRERAVANARSPKAGFARRALGNTLNYGNLQAKRSAFNKQRSDMLQSQIATGDDTNIRDLFIAWDPDANGGKGAWYRRMDMEDGHAVPGASSVYDSYQPGLDARRKTMSLYGGDMSAFQDALYYEWKKTGFDPTQMKRIESQYSEILGEHGFNGSEGSGMMKGVGFRHQGQSLASKYSTFSEIKDDQGRPTGQWGWKTDIVGLTKEGSSNIDTYSQSRQDVTTFDSYTEGYRTITAALSDPSLFDAQGIAQRDLPALDENGQPIASSHTQSIKGKTREQLVQAQNRLKEMAAALNPQQGVGAGRQLAAPEGDGGTPTMAGYGGVSNAPVEVQAAAKRFHEAVFGQVGPPQGQNGPQDRLPGF